MCRYCTEVLEKVTVCGSKWLVTQSGEVVPSVHVDSLLVLLSLALSRSDPLCGQSYLPNCFSHKVSLSGISLIVVCLDSCNYLYNADMDLLLAANYDDLYQWSVESYSDFWAEFWKYSNIVCSRLYDEVGSVLLLQQVQHKGEIN